MKLWITLVLCVYAFGSLAQAANQRAQADMEDNDFAEFEDFDDEESVDTDSSDIPQRAAGAAAGGGGQPKVIMAPEAAIDEGSDLADDDDATVEDDEDEFEHLQDEDEFEGFDKERPVRGKPGDKPQELKITPVPLHLRTNWDSFYVEMLMLAGLAVYFLNFLAGKSKNSRLAQSWFSHHKELLESQFSLVGDDGTNSEPQSGVLMKESENVYSLWCSGRVCCDGMLVTLKLLKRQDLINTIARMFRPTTDQIIVKLNLSMEEAEKFVFCVAHKKVASKMQKDLLDLSSFTELKKNVERLPPCFQLLTETTESSQAIMDGKFTQALTKFEDLVEYIHISDQYTGPKQADDSQETKPEVSSVLICCFNLPSAKGTSADMAQIEPLMKLVFHILQRLPHIRLSKDSRDKLRRNRQRMQEILQKATHTQRVEAAQARKEDKRRAEKERIMAETDPDKQRRLEEKSNKKDAKKKQPKMKTMKVKMS